MNWSADNLPLEFDSFRQYCKLIFDGLYSSKSEKENASYVLLWIDWTGVDVFNSWSFTDTADQQKPDELSNVSNSTFNQKSTLGWPDSSCSNFASRQSRLTIFSLDAATWRGNASLLTWANWRLAWWSSLFLAPVTKWCRKEFWRKVTSCQVWTRSRRLLELSRQLPCRCCNWLVPLAAQLSIMSTLSKNPENPNRKNSIPQDQDLHPSLVLRKRTRLNECVNSLDGKNTTEVFVLCSFRHALTAISRDISRM